MKRKILLFIALVGLVSSAYSQNIYWVDNDGTATWSDALSSAPLSGVAATSMAEANANAQAGDVIFMRGGNYTTTIVPANSGTSGNPITYQRYMEEDVVFDGLTRCVYLDNKHYVVVDGIACYRTNKSWVSISNGSSYNTIKNSTFETAYNWDGIGLATGTHHSTILNNSFVATCTRTTPFPGKPPTGEGVDSDAGGPADYIFHNGTTYDLIEGNDFGGNGGFHYSIAAKTSFSVFRNNSFSNKWHSGLGIVGYSPAFNNVVENNVFFEAGKYYEENFCGQPRDRRPEFHKQLTVAGGRNTIMRGNVVIGGAKFQNNNLRLANLNQRVYNNTSYKNQENYRMFGNASNEKYDGEIFINNILAKAETEVNALSAYDFYADGTASSGNSICNNNIWNASGGLVLIGTNNTCDNSNLNIDPLFIDEADVPRESDLHLQASSPMIDAGQWLTTVTSPSGSGTSFQVNDALFFYDGHGLVKGDVIQLEGQNDHIRIINVDYTTHTLSVDRSISWTQGIGVALPYNGSKPDMGAYEYVSASVGGQTPYKGIVWELPGVLEAENYDNGGEGVSYHDLIVGNAGGKYRTDSVDLYAAGDLGGGYHVGDMQDGEWLEYSINVFNGGDYTLSTRIASTISTGKYSISIDDVEIISMIKVPNTGGDQIWQTLSTNNVSLTTGPHILRLSVVSGGFNLNNITVADTEAPTIPTALTVTEVTSGSISISWTASTDNIGVVEYNIYKKGLLLNTINTTKYIDSKLLAPGKTYSYTVVAKDLAGNEPSQSDTVEATTLQYQSISLTSIEDKYTKDVPFDVEATVTSGLPLTYEVSGPATITGKTITLSGSPGMVEVKAIQAGDATFGKTSKITSFEVILITGLPGMGDKLPTLKIYPIPATDWLKIEGDYSDNAMIQMIDIMGKQLLFQSFRNNSISVSNLPEGVYMLNITDKGVSSKAKIVIQR